MCQAPCEALYLRYFIWSSCFLFLFPTFSARLRFLRTMSVKFFPSIFFFCPSRSKTGQKYIEIYQFPDAFGIGFHTEDENEVSACE